MKKPVSYLRKRDSSKQWNWTQELNEDVYNCHIKAKSDPKNGYMNHLKLYWDELHTEFDHLTPKNLFDQADIVKNVTLPWKQKKITVYNKIYIMILKLIIMQMIITKSPINKMSINTLLSITIPLKKTAQKKWPSTTPSKKNLI